MHKVYALKIRTRYIGSIRYTYTIAAENIGAVFQCLTQIMDDNNLVPTDWARGKLYLDEEYQGTITYKEMKGWEFNPCIQKKLSAVLERLTILTRK